MVHLVKVGEILTKSIHGGRATSWRRALTGIPIHLYLGGFALVGVFSALPTYIYVKQLPAANCPAL